MPFITIPAVREEMLDRTYEDHLVLGDLAFTDEDIEYGMRSCARKFNSIAPIHFCVRWDRMCDSTNVFFDGIAWALLRRWLRNTAMNDVDYSAGNVQASVQGKLIQNLTAQVDVLERQFVEASTTLKVTANISGAFGVIG